MRNPLWSFFVVAVIVVGLSVVMGVRRARYILEKTRVENEAADKRVNQKTLENAIPNESEALKIAEARLVEIYGRETMSDLKASWQIWNLERELEPENGAWNLERANTDGALPSYRNIPDPSLPTVFRGEFRILVLPTDPSLSFERRLPNCFEKS